MLYAHPSPSTCIPLKVIVGILCWVPFVVPEHPAHSTVIYEVNLGFIFDGIGVAVGHRTEIRIRLSQEERENGVPDPSGGGVGKGPHGLRKITFVLEGVDKTLTEAEQFNFVGFTVLPDGADAGDWVWTYTDPGGTGFFDIFVDLDPITPDLESLLKDENDQLGFIFEWMADPASGPLGDGISAGYPFTATLVGIDEIGHPDRFLVDEEEEGFHPFIPEPATCFLLGAGVLGMLGADWKKRRSHPFPLG